MIKFLGDNGVQIRHEFEDQLEFFLAFFFIQVSQYLFLAKPFLEKLLKTTQIMVPLTASDLGETRRAQAEAEEGARRRREIARRRQERVDAVDKRLQERASAAGVRVSRSAIVVAEADDCGGCKPEVDHRRMRRRRRRRRRRRKGRTLILGH